MEKPDCLKRMIEIRDEISALPSVKGRGAKLSQVKGLIDFLNTYKTEEKLNLQILNECEKAHVEIFDAYKQKQLVTKKDT